MKKLYVLILIVLLSACSNKDPITKYLKEDVIIEAGSKIELKNLVDVDNIKDNDLKNEMKNAKIDFNVKNNKVIDPKDVKEDKIYAKNSIDIIYKLKDKEYKTPIEISLKDTKKPNVNLKEDYYFLNINKPKSKDDFIKDLKIDIKDNSNYKIDIPEFDKVDFSIAKENKLKVNVSDEANNISSKDIILFIGENPKTIPVKFNKEYFGNNYKYNTFNIVLPSSITSRYKISYEVDGYDYYINLKNGNEKILVVVPMPYIVDYNSIKDHNEYTINDFKVQTFTISRNEYYAVSWHKNGNGIGLFSNTKNKKDKENMKWVVDTITANSYLN
ncbi:MAG: hypothetical protein RR425_05040 [Erysipelotrichales bacterium]